MVASLGIVVPALVALIGISITWQANKRLAQDRQQSEDRVKLDAAINQTELVELRS
jgi:hypothetical protein